MIIGVILGSFVLALIGWFAYEFKHTEKVDSDSTNC